MIGHVVLRKAACRLSRWPIAQQRRSVEESLGTRMGCDGELAFQEIQLPGILQCHVRPDW